MYKRIIVATDVSAASDAIVRCLACLKDFGARECLLLQCMTFSEGASAGLAYGAEPLEDMLNAQKAMLEEEGFAVTARVVVGAPKYEITRIAKEEDYHLIVIGTQGRSLAEEKLLGGVAYGIISKSPRPVLVIPIKKKSDQALACDAPHRCELPRHVLFATDFSEIADNAFTHVERLVAEHGVKRITLLHNQDKVKIEKYLKELLAEFNRIDRERLERLKETLLKAGAAEVDIDIPYGITAQEILAGIARHNASMVVMGTQGRGFFGEILLGSVSHAVVRQSPVPVLLIPGKS